MFPGAYDVDMCVPTKMEEEPLYIPFVSFIEFLVLVLVASMHPTLPFLLICAPIVVLAMFYLVNAVLCSSEGASPFAFATASPDIVLGSSPVSSIHSSSLYVRSLFTATPFIPSEHIPAERTATTATPSPYSKVSNAGARPLSFIAPRADILLNYDKFKPRPMSFHGTSSTPLFAPYSPCDTPTKGLRPLILVQKMEQGLIPISESNSKGLQGYDLQRVTLFLCNLAFYKVVFFTAALSLAIMNALDQEDLFGDITDDLEPHLLMPGAFEFTPAPGLLNHVVPAASSLNPTPLVKSKENNSDPDEDKTGDNDNNFEDNDDDSNNDNNHVLHRYVEPEEEVESEDPEDVKDIAFFLNLTACLSYDTVLPTPPTSPEPEAPSTPKACAKKTSSNRDCSWKLPELNLGSCVDFTGDLFESVAKTPSLATITEEDEDDDLDLTPTGPRRSQTVNITQTGISPKVTAHNFEDNEKTPTKNSYVRRRPRRASFLSSLDTIEETQETVIISYRQLPLASHTSISTSCDSEIPYMGPFDAYPTPPTSPKGGDIFYDNISGNFDDDPFAA